MSMYPYSVCIKNGQLGVYDDEGRELPAMGNIKLEQDWSLSEGKPKSQQKEGFVKVELYVVVFDSEEEMLKEIERRKNDPMGK